MLEVVVHEFKRCDIKGGTLIVSVPNVGLGNVLLTDFLLEQHGMDQVCAFDSDAFPPVAMMHNGKARFPVRVHADADTRVAVLRSEFPMAPPLMRPLARAILDWCKTQGVALVVPLDSLWLAAGNGTHKGHHEPTLVFSTLQDGPRRAAEKLDLEPLNEGALAGVPAMLILESRLHGIDVVGLLAVLASAEDDLHSPSIFARTLPELVKGLKVDEAALANELQAIENAVRGVQQQAQKLVAQMRERSNEEPGAPGTPSMYM